MKHFSIKDNKCLEETYSKDDIDKKISDIQFQKISGSFIINAMHPYFKLDLNYPEGFGADNTRILCVNYRVNDKEGFCTGDLSYNTICAAECFKDYIRAYVGRTSTGELNYGT